MKEAAEEVVFLLIQMLFLNPRTAQQQTILKFNLYSFLHCLVLCYTLISGRSAEIFCHTSTFLFLTAGATSFWINYKYDTHYHVPLVIMCNHVWDPLTFHLVPLSGQNFSLFSTCVPFHYVPAVEKDYH